MFFTTVATGAPSLPITGPMKKTTAFIIALSFAATVAASPLAVNVNITNALCNYGNGTAHANVTGGTPPYTYAWSTGAVTASITDLQPGSYSVTVTDFMGAQVSADGTIISTGYATIQGVTHAYCAGQDYHDFFVPADMVGIGSDPGSWYTSMGTVHEVPPPALPGNLYIDLGQMTPGSFYSLTYSDMNGCSGTMTGTVGQPISSWPVFTVVDVQGSCSVMPTGSITFTSTYGTGIETFFALRPENGGDLDYISTFQQIGTDLYQFRSVEPGNYWLKYRLGITVSLIQGVPCSSDSVLVTVPDLGPTCGSISGSTFMDYNNDCIDAETNASGLIVEAQPGPYYATSNGNYSMVVPNGSYTLTTSGAALVQSCPAAATVNANVIDADIGHQPTLPLDVAIGMASSAAHPGFLLDYHLIVQNLSSSASGATTTTFTFDPAVAYISATPTPTVQGNTLVWNQPSLDIFQYRSYHVLLQVPPDPGLIGTVLLASANVSTANTDADLSNNTVNGAITVTGSFDPNDKTAYTSSRTSDDHYYLDQDEWIDYVIRFQNTGTDTAFNVIVTDTLPATLDPATITLVNASHTNTWSLQGQGVLKFIFPNILLPDSNVNEAASHGLISFRIRPRAPLTAGTLITNTANIFFDFNPPVITEPSVLMVELSTHVGEAGSSMLFVYPDPAQDQVNLVLLAPSAAPLRLFDNEGRELHVPQVEHGARYELDIRSLPSGLYHVSIGGINARFIKPH